MPIDELIREIERVRRLLEAYMGLEEEPPFDPREGVVYPLYSFDSTSDDYYRILVDLPVADLDTLRVYTEGGDLVIEASLERALEVETPWSLERRITLRRYRRRIPLPPDADPERMEVRVHPTRKIVEILLPRRA